MKAWAKITLVGFLAVLDLAGAQNSTKRVRIHKFNDVVKAVRRVRSFQMTWGNGDEAAAMQISCPDKMAKTTDNDVSMQSAFVYIGSDSWQSLHGNSGPWVQNHNQSPSNFCGMAGLVFPADLDINSAARGEVKTYRQGSCEEWIVRAEQNGSAYQYVYCVGRNNLPVYRKNYRYSSSDITVFDWNKPVSIQPPKDGEPPCCPPMR